MTASPTDRIGIGQRWQELQMYWSDLQTRPDIYKKQNDLHWASSVVEDSLSDALPPMLSLNRPPADQKLLLC